MAGAKDAGIFQHKVGQREFVAIHRIFNMNPYKIDGAHALNAAKSIVEGQDEIHQIFFQRLITKTNAYTRDKKPQIESIIGKIIKYNFENEQYEYEQDGDSIAINCMNNTPIFTTNDIDKFWKEIGKISDIPFLDYDFASEFFGIVLAYYLGKTQRTEGNFAPIQNSFIEGDIIRMTARAEILQALDDGHLATQSKINKLTAALTEIQAKLAEAAKEIEIVSTTAAKLVDQQDSVAVSIQRAEEDVITLHDSQKTALTEIKESLKLDEARKLWSGFANSAANNFWTSFAIITIILITFPVITYYHRSEIIYFLSNLEVNIVAGSGGDSAVASTFTAFGRLLIITAPLGFVVWLVRLLVRFNMRSMLLMDDARARVTMLDTYLFLISQDAAVKQDRGAILEALFRRAPGHGSDTSEPPHFTDLLRYGQEGKGSG